MESERTCIACRKKKGKQELLRIVRNKNGEISIDPDFTSEGRGAYVCKNDECFKKMIKTKALNRTFKSNIQSEVYEKLGEKLGDK